MCEVHEREREREKSAMTTCQSASAMRRRMAVKRRNTTKHGIGKSAVVARSSGERSTSFECAGESTKVVDAMEEGRRAVLRLASIASVTAAATGGDLLGVSPRSANAGIPDVAEVLPTSATLSGFVTFLTNKTSTPALRAGTIKIPYSIDLPANKGWKAQPVANAVSGNSCQPRCDEPWVEEPGPVEAWRGDDRRAREGLDVVDVLCRASESVVLVDEHERRRPFVDERRQTRFRAPAITM